MAVNPPGGELGGGGRFTFVPRGGDRVVSHGGAVHLGTAWLGAETAAPVLMCSSSWLDRSAADRRRGRPARRWAPVLPQIAYFSSTQAGADSPACHTICLVGEHHQVRDLGSGRAPERHHGPG